MQRHHSWTTKSFRSDVTPQRKRCGASGLPRPLQSLAGMQNAYQRLPRRRNTSTTLIRLFFVADFLQHKHFSHRDSGDSQCCSTSVVQPIASCETGTTHNRIVKLSKQNFGNHAVTR